MEGITGMSREWKIVPLGEVIRQRKEFIEIDDIQTYKRARVQLHAKGIVLRDIVEGSLVKTKRQQVSRAGEFLVAEIDAKVGGFGMVPDELDGAIVSSHYFLFQIDETKLERRFLDFYIRTPSFRDQVEAQGSTNYAAIRPAHVLGYQIPLPPVTEQRRIVARIEALAAQIDEARRLRKEALAEAEAMIRSQVSQIDQTLREKAPLTRVELLAMRERGSMRSGPFGSALLHDEFVASGIPAVGIQDVQENRFVLSRRWNVTPEKAKELARYRIKPNDILITVMGTLGRACVVPSECGEMVSTKHIWTLSLDQSLCVSRWLSYWFNFSRQVREELLGQTTGTAIPGLNGEKIKNAQVPNIPVLEQRRIVAELDALQEQVDALKHLQSETAAELAALLPAILDRAFKGEL